MHAPNQSLGWSFGWILSLAVLAFCLMLMVQTAQNFQQFSKSLQDAQSNTPASSTSTTP